MTAFLDWLQVGLGLATGFAVVVVYFLGLIVVWDAVRSWRYKLKVKRQFEAEDAAEAAGKLAPADPEEPSDFVDTVRTVDGREVVARRRPFSNEPSDVPGEGIPHG